MKNRPRRSNSPYPRFQTSSSSSGGSNGRSTDSQRGEDRVRDFRKNIFQRIKSKVQRSDDDDDEEFGCMEEDNQLKIDQERTKLLKMKLGLWSKIECVALSESSCDVKPQTEGVSGSATNHRLTYELSGDGFGHPVTEECITGNWCDSQLTDGCVTANDDNPLLDGSQSGKGEIPLTEVISGVNWELTTNETLGVSKLSQNHVSHFY